MATKAVKTQDAQGAKLKKKHSNNPNKTIFYLKRGRVAADLRKR